MTARLIGRTGKAKGIDREVNGLLTLGSGSSTDLRVDVRTLSRNHAQVLRTGDDYYLEDLNSRNGTFLNGQRVRRFRLRHLDIISLGPDVDSIFLSEAANARAVNAGRVAEPSVPRARIVWLDGPLSSGTSSIDARTGLVLGRIAGLERIAAVSRRHALVFIRGSRVTVEDLGSANGTWVNGVLITSATLLDDGDEISLGGFVRARVVIENETQATLPMDTAGVATVAATVRPIAERTLDMVREHVLAPVADPPRQGTTPLPALQGRHAPAGSAPPAGAVVQTASGSAQDDTMRAAPGAAIVPAFKAASTPPPTEAPPTLGQDPEPGRGIPSQVVARARAAVPPAVLTMQVGAPAPPVSAPSGDISPPPIGDDRLTGAVLDGSQRVTLNLGVFVIGRQRDGDVVLDSRDVGRRHAKLHVGPWSVEVEDLQSSNGTFVEEAKVNGRLHVPDGSRLRFATFEFRVSYVRQEARKR